WHLTLPSRSRPSTSSPPTKVTRVLPRSRSRS
ncbi:MAG: SSU ribosomal protein S15p (S13e), partial [uncultured Friedmanniella sp.]